MSIPSRSEIVVTITREDPKFSFGFGLGFTGAAARRVVRYRHAKPATPHSLCDATDLVPYL